MPTVLEELHIILYGVIIVLYFRGYDLLNEAAEAGNMRALEMIAYAYIVRPSTPF